MANKVHIFKTGGVSETTLKNDGQAFITFHSADRVLIASAPVTGVLIQQNVDFNVAKALDKDFLIAAFGDQPVAITLRGLSVFDAPCNKRTITREPLVEFYEKNKVSSHPNKRVNVGIAGLRRSQAFRCALVSLTLQADEGASVSGYCTYRLDMVGVALK